MKFKSGDRVRLVNNGRWGQFDMRRFVEGTVSSIKIVYSNSTYTIRDVHVLWDNPTYPLTIGYASYELDYTKEHTDFRDKMKDRLG